MDFREKFLTYSNMELLKILVNPDDYQISAIQTAKAILEERQLSEEEIQKAKKALETEKQNALKIEQQTQLVEAKLKSLGKSLLESVNFIQDKAPSIEKTIKAISVLFAGLFIFQVYSQFDLIGWLITEGVDQWDFSVAHFIFPILAIPTATVLFYKKHKLGWLLLMVLLTYMAVSAIGHLILTIRMNTPLHPAFNNLIPHTSEATHILTFMFFAGIIWAICQKDVRAVYSITKPVMISTITITAALVLLGFAMVF